jgi:hypothetical protein
LSAAKLRREDPEPVTAEAVAASGMAAPAGIENERKLFERKETS